MSHSETFEAWRPEKASHFESFRGWGPEKASHFESCGGWRLRKVSHVSHFAGLGVYGLRPGVVWASGYAFAMPGPGHGASRAVGRWLDLGRTGVPVFDGTDMPCGLARGERHQNGIGLAAPTASKTRLRLPTPVRRATLAAVARLEQEAWR